MSICRSGCREQNHDSYAECLQAANVTVNAVINSSLQGVWEKTRGDLAAYRMARSHGIQPESTTVAKVREAEAATKKLGRPYNAQTDPPAHMIVNKKTAKFVNASNG